MSQTANRPKADKKKIHSRNEFELCYLRHQYLRKTDNPSAEEMAPYTAIAVHMAKNTFFTYKNLFGLVGFECDDVVNIAKIHLISFLGLFSLERMPKKFEEFVSLYNKQNKEKITDSAILNKNKANCTLFLKQRMEDVVRVCRQKARNIKGLPTEEFFFYYGKKKPPTVLRDLLDNHEKFGYRKLDTSVYKSIKKKIHTDDSPVFRLGDNYYVAVQLEQKSLTSYDFSSAGLDPHDSIHNMTPEQIFCEVESVNYWENKQAEFNRKNKFHKTNILKGFIEKNKKNPKFTDEIKAARKILKSIEA